MKIFKAEPFRLHYSRDEQIGLIDSFFLNRKQNKPDFNLRMFNEDFSRLFHSMNRRDGNLFNIVSNDHELVKKLLGSFKSKYAPHSVDETIRELVEEIARSLTWLGRAYYFFHDDTEQGAVHLVPFSADGVLRLFGMYVQWLPKSIERNWDRDDEERPREMRILDTAKVMRFDMPRSIRRMISAQNGTLAVLDKHHFEIANFHPPVTHENPNPTNHFDFRAWSDMQDHALFRATRSTGWNGRKYDSPKRSDFFDCYRLIRFRRNQLVLRDDILNQLSDELTRIGKAYKAEFSIEISGTDELPSIAHLNELEVKLSREEMGFSDIIDYCYQR